VLDPCFLVRNTSDLDHPVAVCPDVDGSKVVSEIPIAFSGPFPTGPASTIPAEFQNTGPWSFTLANGQTCRFITGALGTLGSSRYNYYCNEKPGQLPPTGYVLGNPDKTTTRWTVLYAATDGEGHLTGGVLKQVAVVVAYL
jgi:hypothetical protein